MFGGRSSGGQFLDGDGRDIRRESPTVIAGQRKSHVRSLRADNAVKVRRPRACGTGVKRRTFYGVQHSSILTNVTAGQHAPDRGRALLEGLLERVPCPSRFYVCAIGTNRSTSLISW